MGKKKFRDSEREKEIKALQADPNLTLHYNYDGSYYVEYKETNEKLVYEDIDDQYDTICQIYSVLSEYCKEQALPFFTEDWFDEFSWFLQS